MQTEPFDASDEKWLQELANHLFKLPAGDTTLSTPFNSSGIAIPASVAGSGAPPSVVNQGNGVDISDPQTSLPDPHYGGKGVPASVAGSGKSPGAPPGVPGHEIRSPKHPEYGGVAEPSALENARLGLFDRNRPGHFENAGFTDWSKGQPFYYFMEEQAKPFFGGDPAVLRERAASPLSGGLVRPPYDILKVRDDFPILREHVNGHPLIWLDNAATTQKPLSVIQRLSEFYTHENSNIHRAAHELAARSTDAYEGARDKVRDFLHASSSREIVFVRGSTEAINLVAKSWGQQNLKPGDEIIVSHLEHHANIVPWQQLTKSTGAVLRVIPVDDDGQVLLDAYAALLNPRTKLVSFTQVSNALGTITPAGQMVEMAHAQGARVLVDGAQAVSHMPVDVRALNCDWYVFSGHKVFGPTGIGVLYGKEELLNATEPWQGGGNMIKDVTFEQTVYQEAPARFEAGTGNIGDAIGLGAAIDYVTGIGMELISQYEHYLLQYATRLLKNIPGLTIIGTAADKAGVLSFILKGYKTEDVGAALNKKGIAVRSGHHCAQPILRRFGQESTVRPSLALYNTCGDIDALVSVLDRLASSSGSSGYHV